MKIVLIAGSYPPDICGTADYTARLEQSLAAAGVTVEVFTGKRWSLRNAPALVREIGRLAPDIVHMQYPTTGYGWKLGPQAMATLLPSVVTLHEASQAHILRRLSLYPFALRARKIIFTTEYERAFVQKMAPWISRRVSVIPIGSNIVPANFIRVRPERVVTYFGLIRPEKGLEQFIQLGHLLQQNSQGWTLRIVGVVLPGQESYLEEIRAQAAGLKIDWIMDLAGEPLSQVLASTDIAYLPYPDGASERRSSLIGLLASGAAVVTSKGRHTPPGIEGAVRFAASPAQAASQVHDLASDLPQKKELQKSAREYAARFDWTEIAARHIALYESLLHRK
jgi:glycosyltransferase involved in cell wall biosynthesis